ncbi:MAG: hypothetical protein IJU72_01730 [Bacteroidales bacterium]|nr:hypothetical protein [Bacteroidales bacterium]
MTVENNKFKVLNEEDTFNEVSLDDIKAGGNEGKGWCCFFNFACNDKNKEKPQESVSAK